MFTSVKKSALTLALVLSTAIHAPKSHAVVAIASWNPILMGVGLTGWLVGGVSGGVAASGAIAGTESKHVVLKGLGILSGAVAVVGAAVMAAGVITLDDQSVALQYGPIDSDTGAKLKLDPAEVALYNLELDQVNSVTDQVVSDLNTLGNPTAEEAKHAWSQYAHLLSESTLRIMAKITPH